LPLGRETDTSAGGFLDYSFRHFLADVQSETCCGCIFAHVPAKHALGLDPRVGIFFPTENQVPEMSRDDVSTIRRMNPDELGVPAGYSHIVEVTGGRLIFIAGQTATNADGDVVGKHDFSAQVAQVFRNLEVALNAVQCDARNLVKMTVYLLDMENLSAYREARNRFFGTVTPPAAPAITLVEVSRLYGSDFMIEIEAVAAA
jgi:enamine deaminase RidA (YjgF/YER057c/UK114 family)